MTSPITLRALRAVPAIVPLPTPLKTASGVIAASPLVLIDLETSAGLTGHAYLMGYTPLTLKPLVQLLETLAGELVGMPVAPEALTQALTARYRLLGTAGLLGMALAGLETAAWDVLAKAANLPLFRLLGSEARPVRAYASFGMDGIELGQRLSSEAVAQGFTAVKIKAGYPTLDEDLAVIRAVREAIGPAVDLMVDFNQSLTVPEAIRRGLALDDEGLAWIEEPVMQNDYAGHARVAAAIRTPLQLGENWYGLREMTQALDLAACDLVMPDIMKIGGVSAWRGAATLASSRSLPVSSHLFHEVTAHLMCGIDSPHYLEVMELAAAVLAEPMRYERGHALLPERPGNGLSWQADAVARYRLD